MDMHIHQGIPKTRVSTKTRLGAEEWAVLKYWGTSGLLGVVFLYDWITHWNVGATWSSAWLVALLISTLIVSQLLYAIVARHDGRPLRWGASWLFAICNGIFETFAFALAYRFGEVVGSGLASVVAPTAANGAGFVTGMLFFSIYGGLIHGLFWLKLLPPHLNDSPRARAIRKRRPLVEVALVLSWSFCFWLTRDIWTVVFFHILIDLGLMIIVRPALFARRSVPLPQP